MTDNKNSIGWDFSYSKAEISINITRDKLEDLINDFKSMIDYELPTHDLEQEAGLGLLKIHYSPIYVLDFGKRVKLHIDVSTMNDSVAIITDVYPLTILISPSLSLVASIIDNLKDLKDNNKSEFSIGLDNFREEIPTNLVFRIIED